MKLKQLSARNFRNYKNLNIDFNDEKRLNLIISPNGTGKSNLLEIIYYLSHIRSFRNVKDEELIKIGEKEFKIDCVFKSNSGINNVSVKYSNKKKEVLFNNKNLKKYSDMLGKFLTVFFGNEDIFIINGSPFIRKKFFDMFFSIIDKNYLAFLIEYHKILKLKNFILKTKNTDKLLDIYNRQSIYAIQYIREKRISFIEKINALFNVCFNTIGDLNEKTQITYKPSINYEYTDIEDIYKYLCKNSYIEKKLGYSLYGIHRDNYYFLINEMPFLKYASFGQTRLAALIIKLIQSEMYKMIFDVDPILLFDDVMLELDKEKQIRFLEHIQKKNQVFITVTDKKNIGIIENNSIINEIGITDGQIKRQK